MPASGPEPEPPSEPEPLSGAVPGAAPGADAVTPTKPTGETSTPSPAEDEPYDPWAPPAENAVHRNGPPPVPPAPSNSYAGPGSGPAPVPGSGWGPVPPAYGQGHGYGYGHGPGHSHGYGSGAYWGGPEPRNGVGTAALTLGSVGLVLTLVCFGAGVGFFVGIAAIVCGIIGWRTAKRGQATNRGQAIAGIWLGAVSVVLSAALVGLFVGLVLYGEDYAEGEEVAISEMSGDTAEYENGVRVTVSQPEEIEPDDSAEGYTPGDTAYRVTVTVENGSDAPLNLSEYELLTYTGPQSTDVDEIHDEEAGLGDGFGDVLAEGGTVEADFAFSLPPNRGELEIEFLPEWSYEYAYWEMDLDSVQVPETV